MGTPGAGRGMRIGEKRRGFWRWDYQMFFKRKEGTTWSLRWRPLSPKGKFPKLCLMKRSACPAKVDGGQGHHGRRRHP